MAYGVDIKFGEGVYTTDDTYSVIVIGQAEEHGPVKSEQISREIVMGYGMGSYRKKKKRRRKKVKSK